MAFKDIKGHRRIIVLLQRAIIAGRIFHSYLFVGPESIGKKTVALNFAGILNCSNPLYYEEELVDACGKCKSCKKMKTGKHPSVSLIEPEESSIKIEQMKKIQETIYFKPVMGQWHIIIIDRAESMTTEAANCILKLLEEPPPYVIFAIISSNEFLLPSTVVSRCQLFRFNLLSPGILRDLLQNKWNMTEEKALLYSSIANGRIDRAIELSKKKDMEEFRSDIIDLISGTKGEYIWKINLEKNKISILKLNIYKTSAKVTFSFPSDRINMFFDFILIWYRDLIVFKMLKARDKLINIDKLRIIQNEINDLSIDRLYYLFEGATKMKDNIRKNVNTRLVLENFISMI